MRLLRHRRVFSARSTSLPSGSARLSRSPNRSSCYSGTTYVGAAETLAIVFREVCTSCNTGWMEQLERAARPVLEPMLLGAAPGTSRVLNPDQQAILATWAVKTSLLLTLSEFRGQDHGWIRLAPCSGCTSITTCTCLLRAAGHGWAASTPRSARVQAGCLYDASGNPTAQCTTFSVGCVLFQVFTTSQDDADLPPDTETWLAPKGLMYPPCTLLPRSPRFGGRPRPCSVLTT